MLRGQPKNTKKKKKKKKDKKKVQNVNTVSASKLTLLKSKDKNSILL